MRLPLRLHPDSASLAVAHVEVEIARPHANGLVLTYLVIGKITDIRLPPMVGPIRSDNLWRCTCFEAFVRAASGTEYYEFNFSPSNQWAAYRFSDYRAGMCAATEIDAPAIQSQSCPDRYTLQTSLELDQLCGLQHTMVWYLGLCALIDDKGGGRSYWALAHPPGKPDFHHGDGFAHELCPLGHP